MRQSALLSALLLLLGLACQKKSEITPEAAQQMLQHRNLGLAYLEENKLQAAASEFERLIALAPDEPLGHANLGLARFRLRQLAAAEENLQQARKLAPHHPEINLLLAKLYEANEAPEQAQRTLENILSKNPGHVRTLYHLARLYRNQETPQALQRAETCLSQVANNLPGNVAARLELIELLLKNDKASAALEHLESLRQLLPALPEDHQAMFQRGADLARDASAEEASVPVHMFHNVLKATSFYQAALKELLGSGGALYGEPLRRFAEESALHVRQRNEIPATLRFADITATSGLTLASAGAISGSLMEHPNIVLAHADFDADGDQDIFVSQWLREQNRSQRFLFANENGVFKNVAADAGLVAQLEMRAPNKSPIEGSQGGVVRNAYASLPIVSLVSFWKNLPSRSEERERRTSFASAREVPYRMTSMGSANNTPLAPLKGGMNYFSHSEEHEIRTSFASAREVPYRMTSMGGADNGRDLAALFADYDNDGYLDLFISNTRASRLYRNTGSGTFAEADTKISSETNARAAVFADLDLEGDLDLFLATSTANKFYRNNADGTFTEIAEEIGLAAKANGRQAAFADFDDDGDADLFVINESGSNQYFDNLRQGFFRENAGQVGLASNGSSGAVAVGDYNNDGYFDLFVAGLNGGHALYRNRGDGTFERDTSADSVFASMSTFAGLDAAFFDADNEGFLDLVIAGEDRSANRSAGLLPAGVWFFYNNGAGKFLNASSLLPNLAEACSQVEALDYDNDGDLDLLLAGAHDIHLLRNDGGNINNYITVRLAGLRTGSGKNNFFGIGSKVEVKAGELVQVRVMSSPIAHFGLAGAERAEVVRVVWSNGVAQNWLNPERNQTITEDQILKGSCPWLFAWNGERYEFVTDVLWTSALGMPLGIMGKEMGYAFPNSGQDYLKISGEKLLPKEEKYVLQFTSELWEASFVDRIKLLAVDHPDNVEIFVDEKFTPPPYPGLRVYAVANKRLPVAARDGKGNDLLAQIALADGEYISSFALGKYQGLTEPHDLILDLGEAARGDSVFLFLQGWIFPTDASINVHTAQGNGVKAAPPSLEVIDEHGEWKTVIASAGFPKGKNKMMVFDLSGKFPARDHRVRIRTNMQIYWDHIFYATHVTSAALRLTPLEIESADLHYRGFSEVTRATPYSPHTPNYQIVSTQQKWRDLTGAYTRYGEVAPLLLESDSKYVIMNAGDEMTLAFDAAQIAPLPAGWKRDFIFYNDGWVKDGDLNTAHGQTVAPLPFQEMSSYPYGANDAYPSDEDHARFLKEYNTRAVTTEGFRRAMFGRKSFP